MKHYLLLISILSCLSLTIQAEEFHDMSNISKQVKEYLYNLPELNRNKDTKIKVHSVDRRLRLARCNNLSFNLASGANLIGKTSIHIICEAPKEWSFYITATISRYTEIYVSNGSLSKDHILREEDLYKSRKDLAKLPFGYITKPKNIIGKQLKRHIQAGRIISPSQLRNPVVIQRGEIISLQRKTSDFMISMKGTAMMNGAIGERIRVKNNSSKRIVEGTITRAGIVSIRN
ncbi:MAG: flagellar basal body P-ring formation protein FlgA [Gammaproteobacteria bacterium]|nr:flagellar basal body P-ring formation protein FlgA [Gammaproteobacteria bacterium]